MQTLEKPGNIIDFSTSEAKAVQGNWLMQRIGLERDRLGLAYRVSAEQSRAVEKINILLEGSDFYCDRYSLKREHARASTGEAFIANDRTLLIAPLTPGQDDEYLRKYCPNYFIFKSSDLPQIRSILGKLAEDLGPGFKLIEFEKNLQVNSIYFRDIENQAGLVPALFAIIAPGYSRYSIDNCQAVSVNLERAITANISKIKEVSKILKQFATNATDARDDLVAHKIADQKKAAEDNRRNYTLLKPRLENVPCSFSGDSVSFNLMVPQTALNPIVYSDSKAHEAEAEVARIVRQINSDFKKSGLLQFSLGEQAIWSSEFLKTYEAVPLKQDSPLYLKLTVKTKVLTDLTEQEFAAFLKALKGTADMPILLREPESN